MGASALAIEGIEKSNRVIGGPTTGQPRNMCVLERYVARLAGRSKEMPDWDPKDGELCLGKLKPEETLVEDCSDSDVQIDRQT